MVGHPVHDDAESEPVCLGNKVVEVLESTELRVDVAVVLHCIVRAEGTLAAFYTDRIDWHKPYDVYSELCKAWKLLLSGCECAFRSVLTYIHLADFDNFVAEAHRLGLRVIIDWVANHTSPDAVWVIGKPAEWYERDAEGNTTFTADWSDTANLNYENPEVWKGMQESLRFWMERGIDGFRCDMACEVPLEFWQETIAGLRADYPDMYWLAEGEEPLLHSLSDFDASYSWELHHMMNAIARGEKNIPELLEYIQKDAERHPADAFRLMFTSNHDENSWAGTEFERMGDAAKLMAVLTFTLPNGQPLIYTGQEMGWNKRFEFFEKDHIPAWENNEYTEFYKWLIDIRHNNPALAAGDKGGKFEVVSAEDSVLVFTRTLPDNKVTVKAELKAPWSYEIVAE